MQAYWKRAISNRPHLSWDSGRDFALILVGSFLQAISLRLFLVPAKLASGGISGLSQIINFYTGLPIGLMALFGWTAFCFQDSFCSDRLFRLR
jgi:uncharacterized membrane-anchored protein YitT (DUF2179 family)